jgi:hypothetical protein
LDLSLNVDAWSLGDAVEIARQGEIMSVLRYDGITRISHIFPVLLGHPSFFWISQISPLRNNHQLPLDGLSRSTQSFTLGRFVLSAKDPHYELIQSRQVPSDFFLIQTCPLGCECEKSQELSHYTSVIRSLTPFLSLAPSYVDRIGVLSASEAAAARGNRLHTH